MVLVDCPPSHIYILGKEETECESEPSQIFHPEIRTGTSGPWRKRAGGSIRSEGMLPQHFISPLSLCPKCQPMTWQWMLAISPGSWYQSEPRWKAAFPVICNSKSSSRCEMEQLIRNIIDSHCILALITHMGQSRMGCLLLLPMHLHLDHQWKWKRGWITPFVEVKKALSVHRILTNRIITPLLLLIKFLI